MCRTFRTAVIACNTARNCTLISRKRVSICMAIKRSRNVDYEQLDNISSVMLYNTAPKRRRKILPTTYFIERIISMRRTKYVSENFNCVMVYTFILVLEYALELLSALIKLSKVNFVNLKDDEFLIKWSGWPLSSCTW